MITQNELRKFLRETTRCGAEHNGWPCETCFLHISDELTNAHWQTILLTRGDHKKEDLDNLPMDIEKSLKRIVQIIENISIFKLRQP